MDLTRSNRLKHDSAESVPLPTPAKLLAAYYLVSATKSFSLILPALLYVSDDLPNGLGAVLLWLMGHGCELAAAAGSIGLLCRRGWGRKVLVAAKCCVYALGLFAAVEDAVRLWGSAPFRGQALFVLFRSVAGGGLFTGFIVAYLCSAELKGAMLGRPAKPDVGGPAAGGLPLHAKLLALWFIASGACYMATEFFLGSTALAEPMRKLWELLLGVLAFCVLAGLPLLGGIAFLLRRDWGRRILVGLEIATFLLRIGTPPAVMSFWRLWEGGEPYQQWWRFVWSDIVAAALLAFMLSYLWGPAVKGAMKGPQRGPRHTP